MPKCVYCGVKKGKRSCPALGGLICSACCGAHRGRTIHCPADCPYFETHESYQRERVGAVFLQDRQAICRDLEQRLGKSSLRFLYFLDVMTYRHFTGRREVLDHEILIGLEHARKGLGPIMVPGAVPSAFGEELLREIRDFSSQAQIPAETGLEVLDRSMDFLRAFSRSPSQSSRYWRGLAGFVEQTDPSLAGRLRRPEPSSPGLIIPPANPAERHGG